MNGAKLWLEDEVWPKRLFSEPAVVRLAFRLSGFGFGFGSRGNAPAEPEGAAKGLEREDLVGFK